MIKKLLTAAFVLLSATAALADTSQLQTIVGNAESYFSGLNGYVVDASASGVIIDIGTAKKATPGLIIGVYRESDPIVHPITGKTLGVKQALLGSLEVQNVFEEYSIAVKQGSFDTKAGDLIAVEKPVKIQLRTEELSDGEVSVLRSLIEVSPVFTEADTGYVMYIAKVGTLLSCQIMQESSVIYSDTVVERFSIETVKNELILEAGVTLPKGKYVSLAVGKVIQNQDPVIVAAQDDVIHIFNLNSFEKIAEIKGKFKNIAAIDLADLDGDGVDEIFISNVTRNTYAYSCIYKHDGSGFIPVQEDIDFLMRSYKKTDGQRAMIGQHLNSNVGGYKGDIFYVTFSGGKYTKGTSLPGTVGKQLLGFTFLPAADEKDNLMLSIDQSSRLNISTFRGSIYSSSDFFGETFHAFKPTDASDGDNTNPNVQLIINARPRVEVLDQDTYILVKNGLYTRAFTRVPVFSDSSIGVYRYGNTVLNKVASVEEQKPVIVDIYTYEQGGKLYLLTLTSSNKWVGGDPSAIARYNIMLTK